MLSFATIDEIAPPTQLYHLPGFHEPFSAARAVGFALIWTALALYAGNGLWQGRRLAAAATGGD